MICDGESHERDENRREKLYEADAREWRMMG